MKLDEYLRKILFILTVDEAEELLPYLLKVKDLNMSEVKVFIVKDSVFDNKTEADIRIAIFNLYKLSIVVTNSLGGFLTGFVFRSDSDLRSCDRPIKLFFIGNIKPQGCSPEHYLGSVGCFVSKLQSGNYTQLKSIFSDKV